MYVGLWDIVIALILWIACIIVFLRLKGEPISKYFKKDTWWRTEHIPITIPFDFERGVLKERRKQGLVDRRRTVRRNVSEDEDIRELVSWPALFFWILLIESLISPQHVTKPQGSFFHLSYVDFTIGFSVWAIFMIPVILSSKRPLRMSLPASWDHFSSYVLLLIFCLVLAKIGGGP